jgi:16S rRNA processing protein RimM
MQKEDCFLLGHVSKTYSFRGELIFFIDDREPQRYENLESVFVEIHNKLVPFFLEDIRFDRAGEYARVKLEGIDDEKAAKTLLKCDLYLPLSMRAASDEELADDPQNLIGYEVADTALGPLGKVTGFIDHVSNPIIEVNGNRGAILIPFHPHFLLDIDHEAKRLDVEIPEGLIGLND